MDPCVSKTSLKIERVYTHRFNKITTVSFRKHFIQHVFDFFTFVLNNNITSSTAVLKHHQIIDYRTQSQWRPINTLSSKAVSISEPRHLKFCKICKLNAHRYQVTSGISKQAPVMTTMEFYCPLNLNYVIFKTSIINYWPNVFFPETVNQPCVQY